MRRLIYLLLPIALVAVLAGCGSSKSSSGANSSPLATELSYFPSGSPFVLTVQTDPNSNAIKQAHQLESRFPLATVGQAALTSRLQALGLNYDSDIRPLFGHPVALGAPAARFAGGTTNDFLIVWQAADATKLNALLKKTGIGNSVGTRDGAKLYGGGSTSLAVSGSTLVFGPTPAIVAAALDRHAHGGGITNAQFTRETAGLDSGSLSEVFGDLSGELSQPSAASARQIPWVGALRGYGIAVSASSSGLSLKFHLDTTGQTLSQSQLPLAAGATPPALPANGQIGVGIHNPAQILAFAEAAAQQSRDSGYLKFLSRQTQLKAKVGLNLNDFAKLFTGDLLISSDTHTFLARASVSNASQAAADLRKLSSDPADVLGKPGAKIRALPGGLYETTNAGTKHPVTHGMVGNQFVFGTGSAAALRAFATAPTTPATGAQGATAFRIALPQLLALTLHSGVPAVAKQILSQLGDVTGWASSAPSGITGSATLAVK
jgi:hypothetical protein